ncbi:unnamed protein product, partial [Rotaria magnacalcarata]
MSYYDNNLENLEGSWLKFYSNLQYQSISEVERSTRCLYLGNCVLNLVHRCVKDQASLYAEAQLEKDSDVNRAYNYVRKNRKFLNMKIHTDSPIFMDEQRVTLNGLVLLAEEEVDKVILAHYASRFGCGTRVLHEHLNQIYHRISEARISKVLKASSASGQIRPAFSNKEPWKIIQAKQVFERLRVDLVDLSRRPVTHDGFEFRYALVVLDIFSRYLFLCALKKKSSAEVSEYPELIFQEHGTPKIIQTDQGTEFQGVFDDLCNRRNIRHIRSRPYHPESQGKVERINRSWKNKMFYDLIINENTNCVNNLTLYSETYNQSKHRGLGYLTPFYVYFGRDYTQSSVSNDAANDEDADAYVELDDQEKLQENILNDVIEAKEEAKKKANEKIQKYYEKQEVVYEGDACAVVYNVGEEVMVKLTGK